MCIMFHLLVGWVFYCRRNGLAKKLIGLLMILVAVQYSKDLVMLQYFYNDDPLVMHIASSIDIVTVPLYVFVLVEFCRPGWLTAWRAVWMEMPFMLLSLLFILTNLSFFFDAIVVMSGIYGVGCALWTLRELPRYHRYLKEEYSYDEDINLHWLRGVMVLFFGILTIWVVSNIYTNPYTDLLYMSSSLVGWSVVCYFINKQETIIRSVIDTSTDEQPLDMPTHETETIVPNNTDAEALLKPLVPQAIDEETNAMLREGLRRCFDEQKMYLNPKLRLTELAISLGTNRTYLSQYFNVSCHQSFYDYVNNYRVRHSMQLINDTQDTLEQIATMSGFNSMSTFRRAFVQCNGCSPQQYRDRCN